MKSVDLRCRCGKVRGVVDFARASRVHVVCHCGDCRTYARHLDRDDAAEVVQAAPAQITIIEGVEHIRCLRLREKARLARWFTACCGTPLANTTRFARVPFVGLMRCMIAIDDDDDVLGSVVHTNGGQRTPLWLVVRSAWFLLVSFFVGAHRPSSFFDTSGALIVSPKVIDAKVGRAVH